MKKRILCLAIAGVMVVGTTLTANAETLKGEQNWSVSYTGKKLESNVTTSGVSGEILKMLPGDTMELQVEVKNQSQAEVDWYMSNTTLRTLEESKDAAEGGAYTYRLTYVDADQKEIVLYDSKRVGGDDSSEGLHQATSGLEDYFYLDRMAKGKTGYVKLVVALDGETQGNSYQNTLAKLALNFAVEEVGKSSPTTIKTGDSNHILLYSGLAFGSGILLLLLALLSIKRRREEKGER